MTARATRRQVGRFELQRLLGRGAQASVWLAHDPHLKREVALKMLAPGADAQAVSEWLHEAHAVSRLSHPNIVPLFEADDRAGTPVLVFEYVDGGTLSDELRRGGAMPATRAVDLMLGVLDALALAHEQGIVHRDLKPSNVLIGTDGRPRVMDFGIASGRTSAHSKKRRPGNSCIAVSHAVATPTTITPQPTPRHSQSVLAT